VDTPVRIIEWLNHPGSRKIDDSGLESRHNIHHNFRAKGILLQQQTSHLTESNSTHIDAGP
jgi:hypothetical protein